MPNLPAITANPPADAPPCESVHPGWVTATRILLAGLARLEAMEGQEAVAFVSGDIDTTDERPEQAA